MSFSGQDSSRLERGYYVRVEVSILLALAIHAAVLVLAPSYVPRPYRLEASPLRLVTAEITGSARVAEFPGTAAAARPAEPTIAEPTAAAFAPHRAPVIVTEQLKPLTPAAAARGTGRPGAGAGGAEGSGGEGFGGGRGEEEGPPQLFYAFDSPPRILSRVLPEYPAAMKAQGAEGAVILNANVDERGRVVRVWVAQATAPEALVESAIDAMYRFRFAPGSQQGIPVTCTVAVPFNFNLNIHL